MKPAPQFLPPRQQVIYWHTEKMLRETGSNRRSFAMEVAERYLAMYAEDDRAQPFRITQGGKVEDDKKHNGQILGRYLDGTVKSLPVDLEDAWVCALPQPYRDDCERMLALRRGMLSVRMPTGEGLSVASVVGLCQEYGQLMEALGPALANGALGPEDRQHVPRIKREGRDLIAAVLALEADVDRNVYGEGET
ncbi:hypothetical protein [Pseudoxanthomonas mexicana]